MATQGKLKRTFRYRIYPTVRLRLALEAQLGFACQLYNAALEQRRYEWRGRHRSVSLYDQFRELTAVRAASMGPADMNCSAMRDHCADWTSRLPPFFAALKPGPSRAIPAFVPSAAITVLPGFSGWSIHDGRLALQGIGQVKVKWHRAFPASAAVRTVTVRRVAERWYVCFSLRVSGSPAVAAAGRPAVGLDLGIQPFATLSSGEQISGPGAYRAAMRQLRVAQRRVSRRQKARIGETRRDSSWPGGMSGSATSGMTMPTSYRDIWYLISASSRLRT